MDWKSAINIAIIVVPAAVFLYFQYREFWRHKSRRWFIKRMAPDSPEAGEIEKVFESMEQVFESMEANADKLSKSLGMKMPKFPKLPDIKGVFVEWYDASGGKWSPIQHGTLGFKTREIAETVMASLILQDPKQIGKMEVVHV